MSTSSFLDVALEVREIIYTFHLTTPDPSPSIMVNRKYRIGPLNGSMRHQYWQSAIFHSWAESCNRYPYPEPMWPRSLPLLLCNKQVNEEVTEVIRYLLTHSKERLRYEIDCEIVDERLVYPTWLLIPVRFKNSAIPCVHATFRISGQCIISDWAHGNGGVHPMLWNLLILLERFLEYGPQLLVRKRSRPIPPHHTSAYNTSNAPDRTESSSPTDNFYSRKGWHPKHLWRRFKFKVKRRSDSSNSFTSASLAVAQQPVSPESTPEDAEHTNELRQEVIRVEKLIIDVVSPTLEPNQSFIPLNHGWPHREWNDDLIGKIVHPEDVVRHLDTYIGYMFHGGRDASQDLEFLKPRLRSVYLLCDGEERRVWHIAQ